MSGEDASRPYLENLIAPEIKTNKQIKITLDTTETFDVPDSVQTCPFFTAGPAMMRRKASFYLCRLTH
jgi:hypothetical protein